MDNEQTPARKPKKYKLSKKGVEQFELFIKYCKEKEDKEIYNTFFKEIK